MKTIVQMMFFVYSCPCVGPLLMDLDGVPPDLSIIKDFFFTENKIIEDFKFF